MRCERLAISRWGFGDFSVRVRRHARWQLLWLWLLGACQLQSSVHSSTLLVIDIEIERSVRAQSDRISITAAQAATAQGALEAIPVYAEDIMLTGVDDDHVQRVVLQPRGLATPFVSVHVRAESDHRSAPVAEARLDTRYREGEWRIARLRLGADCIGVSCEVGATCAGGACVSAQASWSDLPLYWPSSDAGRTRERDASSPSDAGPTRDAGALSVDAGSVATTAVDDSGIVTGLGQALTEDDAGVVHDPCELARCAEHATCQSSRGDYRCVCERGFHDDGARCASDDGCQKDADCAAAASCRLGSDGRRSCQCLTGYAGDGAICTDIDECTSGALRCGAGATCVNQPGGASCQCALGYVMSMAGSCVDVDECASGMSDCDPSPAACVNTAGGYVCQCPAGWSGTGKGPDGCTGGNPCTIDNGGCDPRRDCLNTSPGPTCGDCMPGYRKDGATGCVQNSGAGGSGGGGSGGSGGLGFPWPPWF